MRVVRVLRELQAIYAEVLLRLESRLQTNLAVRAASSRERAVGALATDPETGKQLWEAVRLLLKRLEKKSK